MKPQRGAAVVLAMLIVALAAIAAANLAFAAHVHWRKLENATDAGQARWLLRAAEQWAAAVLYDDVLQNSIDYVGETWSQEMPSLTAEGYRFSGRIVEQDGRFNINKLVKNGEVDATQFAIFQRLLNNLRLPTELANAVADWLDADDAPYGEYGAEAEYYRHQEHPVRPPNRPLVTVDELAEVRGMSMERLAILRPYITALPTSAPVNVNTAAPELIAALSTSMRLEDAYAIAAQRDSSPFRNVSDLHAALGGRLSLDERQVTFSSQCFLVIVQIHDARIDLGEQALLRRDGRHFPSLVWRIAQ